MERKSKTWIIVLIICLVLFLPIISNYVSKSGIKEIEYDEYIDLVKNGKNVLLYVGDLEKESYDNVREILKTVSKKDTTTDYSSEYQVLSININDLSSNEVKNLGTSNGYVFLLNGEVQKIADISSSEDALIDSVNAYYNAYFNEQNSFYKIVEDAESYKKLVNSKNITVAVFGRDTCYYCNIFKPVYNAVAEKHDIDIYYFDSDNYDSSEYKKIIALDLTIPAECNSSGSDKKMSDGFGTPLTIITKKGKTIGCISGYVNEDTLVKKLTEVGLIEE